MSRRRVHFSDPLHQIKYLEKEWDAASQLARDGSDWLLMGLDRQRFRDRIERTAEILNRILDIEFRQKIYRERFEKFSSSQDTESSQIKLTREFSKKNKISSENKQEIHDKETFQANTASFQDQSVTPEPNSEQKKPNSAYLSWKRGKQRCNRKRRGRNKKRGGEKKH